MVLRPGHFIGVPGCHATSARATVAGAFPAVSYGILRHGSENGLEKTDRPIREMPSESRITPAMAAGVTDDIGTGMLLEPLPE